MLDSFFYTAKLLDRNDRAHSIAIAILTTISALLEIVGVGLIFPIVQVIVDPSVIRTSRWVAAAYRFSGLHDPHYFPAMCTIFFLIFVILKSALNTALLIYQERFYHRLSAKLGRQLLTRYLYSSWTYLLHRNSADMMSVADVLTDWPLTQALRGYPIIASEALVTLGILCVLVVVAPLETAFLVSMLALAFVVSHNTVRKRMTQLSEEHSKHAGERIQRFQQSLTSAKEIKVLGCEVNFIDQYAEIRDLDARVLSEVMVWQTGPRFIIEPLLIAAMTIIIIAVTFGPATNIAITTAVLGLFAGAGIRIIPSLTRVLTAINSIRSSSEGIRRIRQDLSIEQPEKPRTHQGAMNRLKSEIRLENITYQYPLGTAPVLRDLSLIISPGEAVGIVGSSGSGKTTLSDLMLGLLHPLHGAIKIDGMDIAGDLEGWQRQIGYVPQFISLIDASLSENIAFGVKPDEIDYERVRSVISLVGLEKVLARLPEGLDTKVGERGVRLSGGERQRIGIARALYNDRNILVMDEATSALDNETEGEVGDAIEQLHGERTIILIAHRTNTVRRCDKVVMLKDGKILDHGTFDALKSRSEEFRQLIRTDEYAGAADRKQH